MKVLSSGHHEWSINYRLDGLFGMPAIVEKPPALHQIAGVSDEMRGPKWYWNAHSVLDRRYRRLLLHICKRRNGRKPPMMLFIKNEAIMISPGLYTAGRACITIGDEWMAAKVPLSSGEYVARQDGYAGIVSGRNDWK